MISGYGKTTVKLSDGTKTTLAEVLGPLPDELKPLYQKLKPRVEKLNENTVKGYFEVGQLIKQEIDGIKSNPARRGQGSYGQHLFEYLGVALDIHERILNACHRVAERFSRDEYETLVVENGLSWGHARHLARVMDATRREQIVRQIVDNKMSVDDLVSLIRAVQPAKPRGPGRSPAKPRNLSQALDRLLRGERTFQNLLATMFNPESDDTFDIVTEILSSPPDALTPEKRRAVAECIDRLRAIGQFIDQSGKRLKAGLERIDACILAQAEQEKIGLDEREQNVKGRRNPERLTSAT